MKINFLLGFRLEKTYYLLIVNYFHLISVVDFPAINWVVQLDCPENANEYIHRAGRTARYQKAGESLLVLLPSEMKMVEHLEKKKIPIQEIRFVLIFW